MPLLNRISVDVPFPRSIHADTRPRAANRTFRRAQVERPYPPVQCALAVIPTESSNARLPGYGIAPTHLSPLVPTRFSPCVMVDQSAATGNVTQAAPAPHTTIDISVPAAPLRLTELKAALVLRRSQPLTPYKPLIWEALLVDAGLLQKYPSLSQSLCFGFIINIPSFSSTQIPPNSPTITELYLKFEEIVQLELLKKRYIGPFSRQN